MSIAEFALYPVCVARRAVIDAASHLAHLTRWMRALAARPAVSRAMQAA